MEDITFQILFDQIPGQLKDDLLYCRRALHDFLNVHLMLSPCLNNSLEGNGAFKLVVFLETLENEMRAIEREQFALMDELKVTFVKLSTQQDVLFDVETVDDRVTHILNKHSDLSSSRTINPQRVTVRCNASELLANYRIFTEEIPPVCDLTVLSSSNSSIEWLENDAAFKDGYENHPVSESSATANNIKRHRNSKNIEDIITISSPEPSPELPSQSEDKLNQIEFLKNFNLVTHEVINMLKKRRSKRMRVQTKRKDCNSGRRKRVSVAAMELTSDNNGQKRPRGRPRSVGVVITG